MLLLALLGAAAACTAVEPHADVLRKLEHTTDATLVSQCSDLYCGTDDGDVHHDTCEAVMTIEERLVRRQHAVEGDALSALDNHTLRTSILEIANLDGSDVKDYISHNYADMPVSGGEGTGSLPYQFMTLIWKVFNKEYNGGTYNGWVVKRVNRNKHKEFFIAKRGSTCVVGFRGTNTVMNWVRNAFAQTVTWRMRGVRVPWTFRNLYYKVSGMVARDMHTLGCTKQSTYVTGHSQGGAMALLAVLDGFRYKPVHVFASPRTYVQRNCWFTKDNPCNHGRLRSVKIYNYQVVVQDDPFKGNRCELDVVPALPVDLGCMREYTTCASEIRTIHWKRKCSIAWCADRRCSNQCTRGDSFTVRMRTKSINANEECRRRGDCIPGTISCRYRGRNWWTRTHRWTCTYKKRCERDAKPTSCNKDPRVTLTSQKGARKRSPCRNFKYGFAPSHVESFYVEGLKNSNY